MRTSILSPGSMCQSVLFGSLTLRNTNYVSLGGKIMLNFLAKTENLRNTRSERPDNNRGKVVNLSSGKLLFAISDIQIIRE